MSTLRESIDRLTRWLQSQGAPAWSEVAFVEISNTTRSNRTATGSECIHVPKGKLQTVEDFEARFEHLLDQGYAWINLEAATVSLGRTLIIVVEVPRAPGSVPRARVSVNLSGPPAAGGWNASERIKLEE